MQPNSPRHSSDYQDESGRTLTLKPSDNRLDERNPAAPDFQKHDNSKTLEGLQVSLKKEDISANIAPDHIIVDRRHTPEGLEAQKAEDLRIMTKVDEALDEITSRELDTHHRIDSDLRTWCKQLILLANRKRKQYDLEPFTKEDITKDTRELWWTDHLHWDHARKSGRPYAREHIFDALRNLMIHTGLIGRVSRTVLLRHDDKEDLAVHITNPEQLDRALLIANPFDQEYEQEDKETVDKIRETIAILVDGLSQISGLATKDLKKADGLRRLLKTMISHERGIIILAIKCAERLDNLEDIDTNYSDRQKPIVEESILSYTPLLRIFKFYKLYEEFLKVCSRFLNPNLLMKFQNKQEEQGSKIIESKTTGATLRQKLSQLTEENKGITYIAVHPRPIQDYIDDPRKILDPTYDIIQTLDPLDSMHEIVIMGNSDPITMRNIRSAMVDAMSTTDGNEVQSENHPRGGLLYRIYNQDLGGRLRIRIITEEEEVYNIRGAVGRSASSKNIPEDTRKVIEGVIKNTEAEVQKILEELEKDLFKKKIKIRMPNGNVVEFPKGSTVVDACALHSEMRKHHYAARIAPNDRDDSGIVDPWTVLKDNNHLIIETKENGRKNQTSLWWVHLAQTPQGRETIKNHFEGHKRKEKQQIGKTYISQLCTLMGKETNSEEIAETLMKIENAKKNPNEKGAYLTGEIIRAKQLTHGQKKLEAVAVEPQRSESEQRNARVALKNLDPKLKKATENATEVYNQLWENVGKGEVDPLTSLAENLDFSNGRVPVSIILPNTPGTSKTVTELIGNDNINIESQESRSTENEHESANETRLELELKINVPGTNAYRPDLKTKTLLDIFICVLKIQSKFPKTQINSNALKVLIDKHKPRPTNKRRSQ